MRLNASKTRADAARSMATDPSEPAQRSGQAKRLRRRRLVLQSMGIGAFYIVVLIVFAAKAPHFFSSSNARIILDGASMLGIVAIGQSFAIISGGFDLSVGGLVPLGAVVYGKMLAHVAAVPALLLVIAIGMCFGVIIGIVIIRLGINPLIATLAFLSVTGGVAYIISDGQTVPLTQPGADFWGRDSLLGLNNGTLAFVGLAIVAGLVLKFTIYGRSLYTVGGNREAAQLAGLRVTAVSVSAYVFSGACAALAGVIASSQLLATAPDIGTSTTLDSIAAVVLGGAALTGGVGAISGTVLGVLLLGTVANGLVLLQVPSFYQTVTTGLILLLAIGFARVREHLSTSSFMSLKD